MAVASMISAVFAPELFVLYTTMLLAGFEGRHTEWTLTGLASRVGTVVTAFLVAFIVYEGGAASYATVVPGGEDFVASIGLILGFLLIVIVWHYRRWGAIIPFYAAILIGTSVVHILVVPFWDVSSHVVYASVSAGYVTVVDRRFAVIFLVPLALAWSRVAVSAHTMTEAVGGLIGGLFLVGVVFVGTRVRRDELHQW
jgi:hypothetical protein